MIEMSNLYLKIDKVEDVSVLNDGYKIMRAFTKGDFFHFLVKDGEAPETLDLDKHEESIRELLRSVNSMDDSDKINVFGRIDLCPILGTYTISEIREKYDDWKKPKVGDEVECDFGYGFKAIILDIFKRDGKECATLLVKNDESVSLHPLSDVEKTGRHFDNISISALAEYMGAKGNSLHF